jgi:hypothetical protein
VPNAPSQRRRRGSAAAAAAAAALPCLVGVAAEAAEAAVAGDAPCAPLHAALRRGLPDGRLPQPRFRSLLEALQAEPSVALCDAQSYPLGRREPVSRAVHALGSAGLVQRALGLACG